MYFFILRARSVRFQCTSLYSEQALSGLSVLLCTQCKLCQVALYFFVLRASSVRFECTSLYIEQAVYFFVLRASSVRFECTSLYTEQALSGSLKYTSLYSEQALSGSSVLLCAQSKLCQVRLYFLVLGVSSERLECTSLYSERVVVVVVVILHPR